MTRLLTAATLTGLALAATACTHAHAAGGTAHAAVSKDGKTCRRVVDTGSAVPHRECHAPAEWAAIDRQNEANTKEWDNRPGQTFNGRR